MTGGPAGPLTNPAGPDPRPRSVHFPAVTSFPAVRTRRAAFTLLEVLLTLSIIALLAGVLVSGSSQLLSNQPASVDEIFWKAVQAARKTALQSGHEVRLAFVDDKDKGKEFVVDDGGAKQELTVPAASADTLEVSFLTTQKNGNAILVAGVAVETQTIPAVVFYGDGTCTAFRMQVVRRGGAHIVSIDPWTCAPILTPPDPNAPPT